MPEKSNADTLIVYKELSWISPPTFGRFPHKAYSTIWKNETTDGPLTSTGPKKPGDSILDAFKPVMVLFLLLVLFFAALYFLG
ncbi:hypothetical protein V5735_18380 (plasmid) [Haladaptatus sp. SPP-AMP-3]|uniref:hypothetical protein n=1 Tax=Haladaptatus sp. SPP-AMP-3 TaxID=3121295 RepID=UPI003C2C87A6